MKSVWNLIELEFRDDLTPTLICRNNSNALRNGKTSGYYSQSCVAPAALKQAPEWRVDNGVGNEIHMETRNWIGNLITS